MNWFHVVRLHLGDPEYLHVLINPLPVYGLAIATLALVLALFLRNRRVTIAALVLVFITAVSAWPTYHYGEAGYDRVKSLSDPAGEQWLDEHMARGEKLIWAFYVLAAVSALGIGGIVKWPRISTAISVATLGLASATLTIGGYIAYPGGHVRHREFRFEPPPVARAGEHHGGEHEHEEPKAQTSPAQEMDHAGHEQMPQPDGQQPKTEEERKQLEASRLQLEASRLRLEAGRKQLEAGGGASPSPNLSASPSNSPAEHP
jgi:hypothetical protein